ncbi:MAG: hypothetical protein GY714_13200 [Desulfobacterales bacterium]|nr:hypothetical protein [Desulfobacterales bacterium]
MENFGFFAWIFFGVISIVIPVIAALIHAKIKNNKDEGYIEKLAKHYDSIQFYGVVVILVAVTVYFYITE